jgi:hypothetical protein
MKWIVILALVLGVGYAGYEIYARAADGGLLETPAQQEDTSAALHAPEPPTPRPTAAEGPADDDRASQGDPMAASPSGEPTPPPRTDLPNYIRHRVTGAIQQSEQRASGADRY